MVNSLFVEDLRPAPAEATAAPTRGCRAPASVAVECERDIVNAVCAAREGGHAVRGVGARGSKSDCYRTDGVSLFFDLYDRIVSFDGRTVTVQAGAKIGRLNEFLRRRGAVIPTCGEWQGATVAGSIATGCHGGSSRHGVHSSSIASLRLILADGTPLEVDRQSAYFDHAAVSIGAMGIVSTVTLNCTEAFHLELETRVVPFGRFVRDHAALDGASEFFSAVWFPSARRVLTFAANRVPARVPTKHRMERFSVSTFLLDMASRWLHLNGVTDERFAGRCVDTADRILCPIPDRTARVRALRTISRDWLAMEVAVPVASAGDALVRLDRLLRANPHAMLNAVGLRSSAPDAFSLSPCHGRRTFWVDLFYRRRSRQFGDALALTLEGLQGRCHWGKHVGLGMQHLRGQYPRFAEFLQARAALDPDGVFSSPFLRSIAG